MEELIKEQYDEWKKTEDYSYFRSELKEQKPDMFLSSLELTLYTYWYENLFSKYCKENNITFKSLFEMEYEKPKIIKGEIKGIDISKKEDIEKIPEIKGVEKLLMLDKDIPFELPTLDE